MDQPLFSWLHLSDIHFGEPGTATQADKELILIDLVKALGDREMPRPDVILVTGDVAFSGSARGADEYEQAREWLGGITAKLGLTSRDVYVVPGNHDVQRAEEGAPAPLREALDALRDSARTVRLDDVLGNSTTRDLLLARARRYQDFARAHSAAAPSIDDWNAGRLDWTRSLDRDGLRIRLVGLDTAFLANGDDRERLQLGSRQLKALAQTDRREEVVMVLTHHPPSYLRHAAERDRVTALANIHLFGHVHEQENAYIRSGSGGECVHVAAGAVHARPAGEPLQFGFSFGAVARGRSGSQEELKLRIWPWMHTVKHGGFHLDRNSVPSQQEYAEHSLGVIPRHPPARPPATAPDASSSPPPQVASTLPPNRPRKERSSERPAVIGGFIAAMVLVAAIAVWNVAARQPGVPDAGTADVPEAGVLQRTAPSHLDEMVPIDTTPPDNRPGVTFRMGATDGDPDEKPVHEVFLSPYRIDKTEVTVEQYRWCVKSNQCTPAEVGGLCNWGKIGRDKHPINCVTWEQANRYCRAFGKRLPTEAEWEFAARGKEERKYPWESGVPPDKQVCWASREGTCPVGTHGGGATPEGVQDMAGNVWEWVSDWYGEYREERVVNPQGAPEGTARVIRGGAWRSNGPSRGRGADRNWGEPGQSSVYLGFRCARGGETP